MYYHYGKWEEVVLFSEVTNVLSLWEVGGGCPLLRRDIGVDISFCLVQSSSFFRVEFCTIIASVTSDL